MKGKPKYGREAGADDKHQMGRPISNAEAAEQMRFYRQRSLKVADAVAEIVEQVFAGVEQAQRERGCYVAVPEVIEIDMPVGDGARVKFAVRVFGERDRKPAEGGL